ncbi:MAG: hypothetical protein HKN68_15510 [Saprospiraceae bacterium]|nr:hypothetical protein [Saprospiraceae bacterium]
MKKHHILTFSFFLILLISIFSCSDDDGFGTFTLQLNHTVEGEPVEIEQLKYSSQAGHTYSVVNLKYYLSNIVLHDNEGGSFAYDQVHLRDIHDPSTEEIVMADVPDGTFTSLSFTFGLDETINIDGGLDNTIENINMEWPIPGDQGYHYMKFEGRYDSLNMGVIRSYNVHTGATKGNQNYINVTVPFSEIALESNSWMIDLNMDLHEWLHNPNVFDFVNNERIMMNQSSQELLKANGATVFSIKSVNEN